MQATNIQLIASVLFFLAVIHTFFCSKFLALANKFPEGSVSENLFHVLGEVEIVFGLWSAALILFMIVLQGKDTAFNYLESLNFTEPLFVFAIMTIAATRPIIVFASHLITLFAKALFPLPREAATYITCLIIGPLLGSFITEPAAMTVTALILKNRYFSLNTSKKFKYISIAILFVNVSIGGAMTPYAAPPVLMVADKWNWDIQFMLQNFGWKVALAVSLNAILGATVLAADLKSIAKQSQKHSAPHSPSLLFLLHLLFLTLIVMTAHHPVVFIGLFLFFLGIAVITKEYQDELKLRESLLVAFFLGGLVVLGGMQRWWLEPTLHFLSTNTLFYGTTILTAFTDNAALTYLGSQVPNVTEGFKHALVGGAIAGGGLTVIANAPNPAGFSILQESFGPDGIHPLRLFFSALIPTIIGMACIWWL